jgi:uncharacterized delta-60 repeat protein
VTIPAGATSATMTFAAAKAAALGQRNITLSVDAPGIPPVGLSLLVADGSGTLDVTFDADGFASDGSGGNGSTFFALAVQPDGAILAGGSAGDLGVPGKGWLLRRFAPGGGPDPAFAAATTTVLPSSGELRAIAVDAAGKIVCAGSGASSIAADDLQLSVVRLNANGSLDGTFGNGGLVRLTSLEAPFGSIGLALALQPDGKILVAGARAEGIGAETGLLTRLDTNGTRDATFNGGNLVTVGARRYVGVASSGGGVIVAGTDLSAGGAYSIARRIGTGAPDPAFGGPAGLRFGAGFRAHAFTALPGGTFAVAGDHPATAGTYTAGVASAQGEEVWVLSVDIGPGAAFHGLAAQADGRLIAAGHTIGPGSEARVDRILGAVGVRDTTFADAGSALIQSAGGDELSDVTLFAAAVQVDGRILAAGNRTDRGAVVYRLWP